MKLVCILSRFPFPLDKGDKLRAYYQLKDLSKNNDIYLFCLNPEDVKTSDLDELKSFCKEVHVHQIPSWKQKLKAFFALFGSRPIQVAMFYSSVIKRKLNKELDRIQPDHIFCQLIRTTEYVKDRFDTQKTIDYMDALSTGMQRMSSESKFPMKQLYALEGRRLTKYENVIFDYFDQHTIISEQDRDLIYHPKRKTIRVIRNGVDIHQLRHLDVPKKYDLVFHGNMNYPPNVTSAIYIANQILPAGEKNGLKLTVLLSGTTPHVKVQELANDQVTIGGWVNDLREAYCSANIFIAPMLINTGLQNKILEAMSLEVPCVISSMANNAIGAVENEHVLIANSPEEYIQKIEWIYDNPEESAEMIRKARLFIEENYSWEQNNRRLEQLLKS